MKYSGLGVGFAMIESQHKLDLMKQLELMKQSKTIAGSYTMINLYLTKR